jgi:hypothetical protein
MRKIQCFVLLLIWTQRNPTHYPLENICQNRIHLQRKTSLLMLIESNIFPLEDYGSQLKFDDYISDQVSSEAKGKRLRSSGCGRVGSVDDYMSEVWGEAKGKRLRSSGCGRVGSDDGDGCKRKGIASFPLSSSSRC